MQRLMKIFDILYLYFNTVKYLRFRQISYQLFRKLYGRKKVKQKSITPKLSGRVLLTPFPLIKLSYVTDKSIVCLGKSLNFPDILDDEKSHSKLHLYNYHYFDFLNSEDSDKNSCVLILKLWISNYNYIELLGGDAYPTSLRIVNWIKWALRQEHVSNEFLNSLFNQANLLYNNIEYEIDGNHLFSNAKALVFVGLYFEADIASCFFKKGFKIIESELKNQILKDGANFELTPMYHAIMLEDLLDLYLLCLPNNFDVNIILSILEPYINKMLCWLSAMTIDGKEYAHFNDSTQGVVISPNNIFEYAKSLGFTYENYCSSTFLNESGYCVLKSDCFDVICDVANVGADYIPGHAHADTLSYEMWFLKRKLICNLGVSEYGSGVRRLFERGTSSHSTVEINNKNSTNVWSGFRVAERANVSNIIFDNDLNSVRASHNGYKNILHSREWVLINSELIINDILLSTSFLEFKIFHHFMPDVKITEILGLKVYFEFCGVRFEVFFQGVETIDVVKSYYAESYGVLIETNSVVGFGRSNDSKTSIQTSIRMLNS